MADDDEALKALKLKELLGRWSAQIHQQRREFEASADQVSTWDTSLREMVVDLHYLETGVDDLEQDCERIHRGLTEMEHVQKNFGLKLERLQADMERLVPTNPSTQSFGDPPSTYQGQAQLARAQAYGAALELGTLLDSLETVLDEVEQQVKAGQQETHPRAQLRQVLYENISNLQHISQTSEYQMQQSKEVRDQYRELGGGGGGR